MSRLEPPYRLILDGLQQGIVIPFLGSGASLGAREPGVKWACDQETCLPNANELAEFLARETTFPKNEPVDLAKVCQYYDIVAGRDPLDEKLHSLFDRDYPLTSLHHSLADLTTPLLIVTTNYDDLIERALKDKRPFDLVIHTVADEVGDRVLWLQHGEQEPVLINPNKLDIDLGKVTVVYKMHGTVDRRNAQRDQYVITEDDYIDFLVRMTRKKAIPAIFAEPFQTRHFLFLGYSLRDWNLRVILSRVQKELVRRKARSRRREIKSWAIQYKPSPLEQRFWQERGVEVYDMDIEEFSKRIKEV